MIYVGLAGMIGIIALNLESSLNGLNYEQKQHGYHVHPGFLVSISSIFKKDIWMELENCVCGDFVWISWDSF